MGNIIFIAFKRPPGFVNYKKGCTRFTATSDTVTFPWSTRWFSPGTLASSTTKTGRKDIAESGVKIPKIKIKIIAFNPSLSLGIKILQK